MPSLQDIRRRIASVKGTQKITRAMKMVAAAKLRRAQDSLLRARPHAYALRGLAARVAAGAGDTGNPLLSPGRGDTVGLIVVTSDRGLCGGFNANIVNAAMRALEERFAGRPVELIVVGRKGLETLRRRPCVIRASHTGVFDKRASSAHERIIGAAADDFLSGRHAEVHCLYNEFKSAISQKVTVERLLPFDLPDDEAAPSAVPYLFEPDEASVLSALVTENLHVQMNRILLESAASEQGARMAAMDAATKNAGEVMERLTLKYNRARQDAITREVVEVVSGVEAL
ncbi:MAG: ATP synthase F1 subunit gamma [Candidatus Hydrogenedentes bacterium]|nr:ATP synthase F1 subunit gamma [Candidatus Hydrogenedentota bacterium]